MVVSCLLAPVLSKPVVPISEETLTLGRCSEDLQRQVRKVAVSPCSLPLLWQCSSGVRIVEAQETRFFFKCEDNEQRLDLVVAFSLTSG